MISKTKERYINLAERPDLVLRLESYGIIPKGAVKGPYTGKAQQWAAERREPYDDAKYQALADRMPEGWENVTTDELYEMIDQLKAIKQQKAKEPLSVEHLGNAQLLKNFIQIALVGFTTAASVVRNAKLAKVPGHDKGTLREAENFAFFVMLQVALESIIPKQIFQAIGAATGLNESLQDFLTNALHLVSLLGVIKLVSIDNRKLGVLIVSEFSEKLINGIEINEKALLDYIQAGKLSGSIPNGITLFLQQGKLALQKGDFEGFLNIFEGALELIGIRDEDFENDLKEINRFGERIYRACTIGMDDQTNTVTGISQA